MRPEDSYFREQLQSRVYNEQLLLNGKEYFGFQIRVKIELKDMGESLAKKREREKTEHEAAVKTSARNHPIINEARSLFGGELGPIELTEQGKGGSNG